VGDSPAGFPGGGRSNGAAILLWASAALAGVAAALILTDHRLAAGLAALGSAAGLLFGTSLDGRRVGLRARFAGYVLAPAFDACVLGPLVWVSRVTAPRVCAVALLGLGASFAASYERAKAVSLGYRAPAERGYGAVRMLLPVIGLVTGYVEASLWAFLALTLVATGVRAWNVAAQHRRRPALRPAGPAHGC
jgi:hypothetical protein